MPKVPNPWPIDIIGNRIPPVSGPGGYSDPRAGTAVSLYPLSGPGGSSDPRAGTAVHLPGNVPLSTIQANQALEKLNAQYDGLSGPTPQQTQQAAVKKAISNHTASSGGPSGPSTSSLLDSMYAALLDSVNKSAADSQALYDQGKQAVGSQYDAATQDMYNQYMNSRNELADGASNLGVKFDSSNMGKDWDLALRKLQETSDQNRTIDQNWFDKMKSVGGTAYDALKLSIQQELADRKLAAIQAAQAAASKRQSGGGGKSGGSSGGSASTTSTVSNVGDLAAYNALKQSNPAAAALWLNIYNQSARNPNSAIAAAQNNVNQLTANAPKQKAASLYDLLAPFTSAVAVAKNNKKKSDAQAALDAFYAIGKGMGTPATTQTVKTKG